MILAVTGGRSYGDRERVYRELDEVDREFGVSLLVHGGATGADTLAKEWAEECGVLTVAYPYIGELGKRGGPVRNRQMLQGAKPDLLVAFPGGNGTRDCVKAARAIGITVVNVEGQDSEAKDRQGDT